jgi:hypothetical protein
MSNSPSKIVTGHFWEPSAPQNYYLCGAGGRQNVQKGDFRQPLRLFIVLIVRACHFQCKEATDLSVSTP